MAEKSSEIHLLTRLYRFSLVRMYMIYLAILLIVLGLFFFIKAFQNKGVVRESQGREGREGRKEFRPTNSNTFGHLLNKENRDYSNFLQNDPNPSPPVVSTPRYNVQQNGEEKKEVLLKIRGVFYLDQDRVVCKLPRESESLAGVSYVGFQRIGIAQMVVQNDVFTIESSNATYAYPAKNLDQVIFRNVGVAFIPNLPSQAVGVFLSKEAPAIKKYIQANSNSVIE